MPPNFGVASSAVRRTKMKVPFVDVLSDSSTASSSMRRSLRQPGLPCGADNPRHRYVDAKSEASSVSFEPERPALYRSRSKKRTATAKAFDAAKKKRLAAPKNRARARSESIVNSPAFQVDVTKCPSIAAIARRASIRLPPPHFAGKYSPSIPALPELERSVVSSKLAPVLLLNTCFYNSGNFAIIADMTAKAWRLTKLQGCAATIATLAVSSAVSHVWSKSTGSLAYKSSDALEALSKTCS